MILRRIAYSMSLSILMLVMISCGGGGGDSTSEKGGNSPITGKISDSYIQGLRYTTATQSGTTDANGTFSYLAGETVSFYVGEILIGSTVGKSFITPFDLVPGAINSDDPTIGNLLRFLITLDSDNNPDNGITIAPDVAALTTGLTLDFTMTTGFDAAASTVLSTITGGAKTALIDMGAVKTHVSSTLLSFVQGDYSGTYSGVGSMESGVWTINIDASGTITGTSTSSTSTAAINLTGTLYDNGSFTLTGTDGATTMTYNGQFNYLGGLSGTWTNGMSTGTFTGNITSGGGGGTKVNDLSFLSAEYGRKYFTLTKPMVEQVYGPLTMYPFFQDYEGYPQTFIPQQEIMTLTMVVDSTSNKLTSVLFGYYNTGDAALPPAPNYYYRIDCDGTITDPCLTVSFNSSTRSVTFNDTKLMPDETTPDFPNAATTDVIASGILNW